MGFCVTIVFLVVAAAVAVPYLMGLNVTAGSILPGSNGLGNYIAGALGSLSVPLVLFVFALSVVIQVTRLLTATGVALWMRQFDVPRWGKSSDPLPGPVTRIASEAAGSAQPSEEEPEVTNDARAGDVPTDAPATRTITTIVRVPGEAPKVESKTEVIQDRGVIHQGPGAGDKEAGHDDAPKDPRV